jgi:hypothetical protein
LRHRERLLEENSDQPTNAYSAAVSVRIVSDVDQRLSIFVKGERVKCRQTVSQCGFIHRATRLGLSDEGRYLPFVENLVVVEELTERHTEVLAQIIGVVIWVADSVEVPL